MRISDWSSDVCSSDLLQVLKGQPHPRLTLRVSPYACPELPHFLSAGTILTIYLAFPASFSTVESPRYCLAPWQVGRGITETLFRFRYLRAIHFCDRLWGMDMNDLRPARTAGTLIFFRAYRTRVVRGKSVSVGVDIGGRD